MNAAVTRNRELISRSGSNVRAADGVARGGDPPRHSVFFVGNIVTELARVVSDTDLELKIPV